MNRQLYKVIIGVLLLGLIGFGTANAQIATTGHNMTNATMSGFNDNCRYCHTPHGALTNAPLWTRNPGDTAASAFVMYNSPTLDAANAGPSLDPGPESMSCLSCHDGVTAFDNVTGRTETASNNMNSAYTGSVAILSTDLTNDHPIGVTITGVSEIFQTPTSPLYGTGDDIVECATCHDPHATTDSFLRIQNDLCIDCHDK